MCSRAVNIEVLDKLSSYTVINALRCLIAICGNVRQFDSDQGINFVGPKNEFAKLMRGLEP